MAEPPIPAVRLRPGLVVGTTTPGVLAVNVDGARPPVWWPAGYIPTAGDAVRVLVVDGEASVLGPVIGGQRPEGGTVAGAAAAGVVPVDTVAGTVQARYTGDAPQIGSVVFLDWQMTTARILPGVVSPLPPPTTPGAGPGEPAGPPPSSSGTLTVTALDSGTWSSRGVWDSYYGTHLTQGSYGGRTYAGAWFYGAAPQQAAGRTVTAIRLRLGARRRMGSYNAPLVLQLYRHTSATRPGGDVARVAGPHTITLAPSAGAQWVDLPVAFGQALADTGGGIAIAGGTYGGITGIGEDPASGQLQIDWRT
ncbi:hypothetical protein [Cellulomonas iranensis]|uniref:hypothetical protein n=1 Tax=Cellulomonas iranensis TaxID=76862 RepID=UPI000B3C8294|nr:hypothetical protein [Cellulomonas iranensis]